MANTYKIYLISDSTGETLERIFMALKAQFQKFDHNLFHYSFTRTENQILKILEEAKKKKEAIILYTIVDNKLAKFLSQEANKKNIPCFGVLGDLIINFSKLDIKKIDFLDIDVEGADLKVLKGLSFEKYNPELICVEIHDRNIKESETYKFLNNLNYELIWSGIFSHIFKSNNYMVK